MGYNYLLQLYLELSNKQFGFIKGLTTALHQVEGFRYLTSKLEDGGQNLISLYTDFEKALTKCHTVDC